MKNRILILLMGGIFFNLSSTVFASSSDEYGTVNGRNVYLNRRPLINFYPQLQEEAKNILLAQGLNPNDYNLHATPLTAEHYQQSGCAGYPNVVLCDPSRIMIQAYSKK